MIYLYNEIYKQKINPSSINRNSDSYLETTIGSKFSLHFLRYSINLKMDTSGYEDTQYIKLPFYITISSDVSSLVYYKIITFLTTNFIRVNNHKYISPYVTLNREERISSEWKICCWFW